MPSECVLLNGLVFGDIHSSRRSRGGGNVGIGFIDFQGLWGRSENSTIVFRAFHKPSFPRPASIISISQAAIFTVDSIQFCSNSMGLT